MAKAGKIVFAACVAGMAVSAARRGAVNPRTVRDYGFARVASEVKDFICCDGYGHIDLLLGLRARDEVFPRIAAWLDRTLATS